MINYTECKSVLKKMSVAAVFIVFSICSTYAQSDTIQTNVPSLKNVYANDFKIGCILSYRNIGFPTDPPVPGQSAVATPNGGYLVKFHMNIMTPGNNMKPQYTVNMSGSAAAYNAASGAAKDSVDVHPIVRFNGDMTAQLNWVKRQGFSFRGHTLVWHSQTPAAFFRSGYTDSGTRLSKEKMTQRLENYISEVIRIIHESWPGVFTAVDVVNEAVNDNGSDRTTDSEWYLTFGDNSYIMKAFEFARKYTLQYGEPQIKLYYNDYNTATSSKADGIVRLLTPVYQAGLLDGIGMQEHDALTTPTAAAWIASYNKFDPICTEMAVTEIDVKTGSANPSAAILQQQANQYGQLFKCFVERSYFSGRGKIISVTKDGLNDQYTFVTNQSTSLWDSRNQCKPAFFAVANVGIYYNKLDSLINYCDSLQQGSYSEEQWSSFSSSLTYAKGQRDMNYSVSLSASESLMKANDSLSAALNLLTGTTGVADNYNTPASYQLNQNYPNPFNPATKISFNILQSGNVVITLYDALGNSVKVLTDRQYSSGYHEIELNASGLASGMYFYKMQSGDFTSVKKLMLLR